MIIRLPRNLRFPVTITSLQRAVSDDVPRLSPLLVYSYEATVTEYPEYGVEREMIRDLSSEFHCPVEGKLLRWMVEAGTVVLDSSTDIAEIEEPCTHDVQWGGLCTICGKDMTQVDYTGEMGSSRATVRPAPDSSGLLVSENEARRLEEDAKRRLLASRKLSLVVDLDCTIIHATVDPTVGEWKNDPTCVNYESVKDVQTFQLQDNVMGGRGTWYYVKLRPGLQEFLEHIAQLYELHIYTMGTRAYAMSIKKIVDPDGRFFGDRVLSRDENGNMSQKSLHKLFPVDTKMVVIIDDRGDVWKWSENLVKVRPYDFFIGIGDINSSFLPKQQVFPGMNDDLPANPIEAPATPESLPKDTKNEKEEVLEDAAEPVLDPDAPPPAADTEALPAEASVTQLSALEQLITSPHGEARQILTERTEDLDKALAAQKEDRPLARKQELQDRLDERIAAAHPPADGAENNSEDSAAPAEPQKHSVLRDNDAELPPLKTHLSSIHREFFTLYDTNIASAANSRVSQLKKPKHKRLAAASAPASLDLHAVPDVAYIMPRMKRRALAGCVLVFSGVIPLGCDIHSADIVVWAKSFGAAVADTLSARTTHVVAARSRTAKVRQAASKFPAAKIVAPGWLYACLSQWHHEDETPWLVDIHPEDRLPGVDADDGTGNGGPILSSEDEDSSADEDEDMGDLDLSSAVGADGINDAENDDADGMSDAEAPQLSETQWTEMDDELREFLDEVGSDDGGDSGSDSDASESSTSSSAVHRPRKRSRSSSPSNAADKGEEAPAALPRDGEEADAASRLAKRQRVARARGGSSLKLSQAAADDEDEGESAEPADEDAMDELDDELAADLERELERELEEAIFGDGDGDGEGEVEGGEVSVEADAEAQADVDVDLDVDVDVDVDAGDGKEDSGAPPENGVMDVETLEAAAEAEAPPADASASATQEADAKAAAKLEAPQPALEVRSSSNPNSPGPGPAA